MERDNSKGKDDFVLKLIKMITELNEAETYLNNCIYNNIINKKQNFVIFNKKWLEQWKIIVAYEEIKNKCKNINNLGAIKKEIYELFIKLNTKQRLNELGKMDCTELLRRNKYKKSSVEHLNEKSDFIPIIDIHCTYFLSYIKNKFTVRGEISNGVIYIYDTFPEKNINEKLTLLYKEENNNNNEFKRAIITLEKNIKKNEIINNLKKKNINEILSEKKYNIQILNSFDIKNYELYKEEEERIKREVEKKRREEEEKRKKELELKRRKEEEEKKRKEEEEKNRKEEERMKEKERKRISEKIKKIIEKNQKMEEENKKREIEKKKREKERISKENERRRIEEEEKKRREEEEIKRREEEEKKRKEEEKIKRIEEEERKRIEEEKKRREEEERKRNEEERKRKEEEINKRIEEERKRREEEERIKREVERKRREEEERIRKEEEIKRRKEEEETKRKGKTIKEKEDNIKENNKKSLIDLNNKNNENISVPEEYLKSIYKLDSKKKKLKDSINTILKDEEKIILECILCMENFEKNEIANPILECKKYFHGKCFINYIDEELNNNHFPIRCPFCTSDEKHEINYKIVLDCLLFNNKDKLAIKLENMSLNYLAQNNPDEVSYCPTAGCNYMCYYDKNDFHLDCPLCRKSYCLKCKVEWHQDLTCEQYQLTKKENNKEDEDDIKFEEYVKGNNFKKCPKCKRWVEKISGCDHIVCPCGTHFCYSCGEIRDPQRPYEHNCPNANNNNFMNMGMNMPFPPFPPFMNFNMNQNMNNFMTNNINMNFPNFMNNNFNQNMNNFGLNRNNMNNLININQNIFHNNMINPMMNLNINNNNRINFNNLSQPINQNNIDDSGEYRARDQLIDDQTNNPFNNHIMNNDRNNTQMMNNLRNFNINNNNIINNNINNFQFMNPFRNQTSLNNNNMNTGRNMNQNMNNIGHLDFNEINNINNNININNGSNNYTMRNPFRNNRFVNKNN